MPTHLTSTSPSGRYPALSLSLFERALRRDGSSPILSYTDKYLGGEGMVSAPRELPAQLAPDLEKELRDAAVVVAALAGVRGVWRLDFLVDRHGAVVGERGQHHPGLARQVPLGGRRRRRLPHASGGYGRRGQAPAERAVGLHREPMGQLCVRRPRSPTSSG